ncbi:SDR family NAD(P)-dependent oxidoreductase [Occallatibacter riparius]|uniref:SDR family oxidoreductase n=1 Tax=Occallatibacter riparius TaxID=1002689 RepID=A0A9J7BRN5_9BACT|nr:SDR family oxidoreductase [Occallatibacter riparius]UWZ83709.1 SDR family oxidoreductase [Occallatibacter riparius]
MRNVLVTGGSRGLGLGIVRKLTAAGYRVIAIARGESEQFREAQNEIEATHPGSLVFSMLDLAEIEKIAGFVSQVRKEYGPIYGLVNNAGISHEGTLAMMPMAQIEKLVRVNVLAPIVLTKYVARGMMSDGSGRIVNVSSIMAFTGFSGLSVYGATKSSLIGFTRSLAREVGRNGITVNSVAPGFIETQLTEGLDAEERDRIKRRSALRRFAEVDDVANAVEYLLSDKAKNITGTVITVDAGSTA